MKLSFFSAGVMACALVACISPHAFADPVGGLAISPEGKAAQYVIPVSSESFGRVSKIAAGSVVRTPAHQVLFLQLMPGYVIGLDADSELLITSLDQTPLGSSAAKRTMLVELRKGRMAGLLERFYPNRTNFHTTTVNGFLANESMGLFVISTDGTCTRDVQVLGNADWTSLQCSDRPITHLRTGNIFHCCPDCDIWWSDLASDSQGQADRAFGIAMLRKAIEMGLLEAGAFSSLQGELTGLQNDVRDRLLNPANFAGLSLNPFNSPHIDTNQPPPPLGAEPPVVTPDPVSAH